MHEDFAKRLLNLSPPRDWDFLISPGVLGIKRLLCIILTIVFLAACLIGASGCGQPAEKTAGESKGATPVSGEGQSAGASLGSDSSTEQIPGLVHQDRQDRGQEGQQESVGQQEQQEEGQQTPPRQTEGSAIPDGAPAGNTKDQITLLVTTNFGDHKITDTTCRYKNDLTVMDVTRQFHEVATSYGGGFVDSIDDLKSGYTSEVGNARQKMDWFYFINGVQANVGCAEYILSSGDVVWWDYHDWNNAMFVPAITGCYPEPFLGGYEHKTKGTLIMYASGNKSDANKIKTGLELLGVQNVGVEELDSGKVLNRKEPTIILGLWEQIGEDANLKKIMDNKLKTGIFLELSNNEFIALNVKREKTKSFTDHPGAIFATGNGSGDKAPLWIVTGMDEKGLTSAISLLTEERDKLKGTFGLIVEDGRVVNVPTI